MEVCEQIKFQITTEEGQVRLISYDPKILQFRIQYLSNNHHEPYPIPENIAKSTRPFEIMRQFLQIHNYDPSTIKIIKPIRSSKYYEVVDPLTFKLFQSNYYPYTEYVDESLMKEVEQVIILSRFLRFEQLTDAISAAVAVNFYINIDDQKELQQYKKREGLDDIESEQICQIIEVYESQFKAIEVKAKQELLKITQNQIVHQ